MKCVHADPHMLHCVVLRRLRLCSYMYLGVALTRLEDHDNAAAAYRKAVSLEPAEPLFHLNYGEYRSLRRLLANHSSK